jgi:hypothetical protein
MSTYEHYQQAKNMEVLPQSESIGACLTCRFWDVEQRRQDNVNEIARCVHPDLRGTALLVSGSSACNLWAEKVGVEPEARQYATSKS